MGTRDPRVDEYIAQSADFAKPILTHIRDVVHEVCPEVEETIKWSVPHFTYKGNLCMMAAFKQHCGFGFWKEKLITDDRPNGADDAMGQFGRLTAVSDLPSKKVLVGYIKKAMALNDSGITLPARGRPKQKQKLTIPAPFAAALKKNRKARAAFDAFAPSHRREYIAWIAEAKGDDTRARRIATAIEWIAEGKPRNWKYMKSSGDALTARGARSSGSVARRATPG